MFPNVNMSGSLVVDPWLSNHLPTSVTCQTMLWFSGSLPCMSRSTHPLAWRSKSRCLLKSSCTLHHPQTTLAWSQVRVSDTLPLGSPLGSISIQTFGSFVSSQAGSRLTPNPSQSVFQVFAATATMTPQTTSPPAAASSRTQLSLSLSRGVWMLVEWTYPAPASTQTMVTINDTNVLLLFKERYYQMVLQTPFIISICIFAEIFADEKCSVLNNPTGIFAKCHGHIPTDRYHTVTRLLHQMKSLQLALSVMAPVKIQLVFVSRLVSKEHATVAAVCSSACALLWAAMPKPAAVWVLQLVTGGKLPTAVSSALTYSVCILPLYNPLKKSQINSTAGRGIFHAITMLSDSSEMSEEPRILLQHASLQPHMPFPVCPWPSLWPGCCSCGGLWLSRGNSPEPRTHLYPKSRVCLSLPRWYNATGLHCYRWTTVVSWPSEYSQPFKILTILILTF